MTRAQGKVRGRLRTASQPIPDALLDASDKRLRAHWLRMAEEAPENSVTFTTYLGFAHDAEDRIHARARKAQA